MRHKWTPVVLLALLAACGDAPTGTASVIPGPGAVVQGSLGDHIEFKIAELFPTGLETATGKRWRHVTDKLAAGDEESARKFLVDLVKWIGLKENDITPPAGETKHQAGTALARAMSVYVFEGPNADVPQSGPDLTFEVVPAGEAATIVTPQKQAGLDLDAGSTSEDRIIVISKDPRPFPKHCAGPLDTKRCQYPQFYIFESFPKTALNTPGGFAVCMAAHDDSRQPLDHPGQGDVHARMRLAHDAPPPGNETDGGTLVDGIEILPQSARLNRVPLQCAEPATHTHANLGRGQRMLHAVMHFAGRILTPKDLYAWDSGPEHDSRYFSNFNGVDGQSAPDMAVTDLAASPTTVNVDDQVTYGFVIENRSQVNGGQATASSQEATAVVYLSTDQTVAGAVEQLGSHAVPSLAPDETFAVSNQTFTPTNSGTFYIVVTVEQNASTDPLAEVTLANNTAAQQVVVNPVVTGVSVAPASAEITVGQTQTFVATVTGKGSFDNTVQWTSSNTSVATVNSSGVATGVAAGSATIRATSTADATKFAEASLTVNAATTGDKVLVFGDRGEPTWTERSIAQNILTSMGYTVESVATLPTDLSTYKVIWHVGAFVALTASEVDRLVTYLGSGGSVHLTGERPCCEALNASIQSLVNAAVVGGGVTVGGQGDFAAPFAFNSTAFGNITTSPNTLTNWAPSAPGGMLGVSGANVFVTHSGTGTVVGAVWGDSHLTNGKGRLTLLMDVNWFTDSGASTVMRNIQNFLDRGTGPAATATMTALSISTVETTSDTCDTTMVCP